MRASENKLLEAIETVHAAGLDEECWPQALGAATRLLGANCATLETLRTSDLAHLSFRGFNTPPAAELLYLREYVPLSPRTRFAVRRRGGDVIWDYQMIDEAAMDRDPFYMGFLRQVDLRYFYGAVVKQDGDEMTAVTFHRPRKAGHVGRDDIALIKRLVPHFRQAYNVNQRLKEARTKVGAFQAALDWLTDGVALLAADGTVLYANETLEQMALRGDGICITRRTVRLADPGAATQFALALGAVARLRAGDTSDGAAQDFSAARALHAPPYLLSLRPVTHGEAGRLTRRMPAALLFVHDPLSRHQRPAQMLRQALGLTEAEANLALALQEGLSVTDYARARAISLNTAYTHLRRIKEKTGCKHLPELVRWLNDLHVPLRHEK
jgi:DNA-binding CsgD family transcriptional regulator